MYLFSLFIHVSMACLWIGGMLFLPLVLLPSIKDHPDRVRLLYFTGLRFRTVGWIALSLLFVSGVGNYLWRGMPFSWVFLSSQSYGNWVLIKLALFVCILALSAYHDFLAGGKAIHEMTESNNNRFRMVARWTGRINLIIALLMVIIGLYLSRGAI